MSTLCGGGLLSNRRVECVVGASKSQRIRRFRSRFIHNEGDNTNMKPMLDQKRDLKGATPKTLALALLKPLRRPSAALVQVCTASA